MIINRKNLKNSLPNDFWKEVDKKTQVLITEILQEKLPIANLNKNLDLNEDKDYTGLLPGYQAQYSENLPESDLVASEIAYEYLLEVSKSVIKTLKNFVCHSPEYMEDLVCQE